MTVNQRGWRRSSSITYNSINRRTLPVLMMGRHCYTTFLKMSCTVIVATAAAEGVAPDNVCCYFCYFCYYYYSWGSMGNKAHRSCQIRMRARCARELGIHGDFVTSGCVKFISIKLHVSWTDHVACVEAHLSKVDSSNALPTEESRTVGK